MTNYLVFQTQAFKVTSGYSNSFVWQLEPEGDVDIPLVLSFRLNYEWLGHDQAGVYTAAFKLDAFKVSTKEFKSR